MCALGGMQHVILHRVERVERRHLFGFALQPACDRRQQVFLAVLEHVDLGAAVEQAALFLAVLPGVHDPLHDRFGRSAFHTRSPTVLAANRTHSTGLMLRMSSA